MMVVLTKKRKSHKNIERDFKPEDYKKCLESNSVILRSKQRSKGVHKKYQQNCV